MISRSRGWDKEIPHCVLPMEQLVLSDKWARIMCLAQGNYIQERIQDFLIVGSNLQGWGGGGDWLIVSD